MHDRDELLREEYEAFKMFDGEGYVKEECEYSDFNQIDFCNVQGENTAPSVNVNRAEVVPAQNYFQNTAREPVVTQKPAVEEPVELPMEQNMLINHPFFNEPKDDTSIVPIIIHEQTDPKSIEALAQKNLNNNGKKKEPNYIKEVMEVLQSIEYLCDPLGFHHAIISTNGVVEYLSIDSSHFNGYINKLVYEKHGIALDPRRIKTCLAIAYFDISKKAKPAPFILRFAQTDSTIYINQGLKQPSFIKVDCTTGKREYVASIPYISKIKPVQGSLLDFKKSDGTSFEQFFSLMVIDDKLDKLLIVAYLVSKMFPERKGILFHILGGAGFGKSSLAWGMKSIVDPGDVEIISEKKDELVQLFDHNSLPVLDNLGRLSADFSNTICALVTGSSYKKRVQYTNDDDFTYKVLNNCILTSTELPNAATDLLSRVFFLVKKPFKAKGYTMDSDIRESIIKLQPCIFDELIDIAVEVKKALVGYKIYGDNRNMDFIAIGKLTGKLLFGDEALFDAVVTRNNGYRLNKMIDASAEASAIIEFMADKQTYTSTPTKLIADLDTFGCNSSNYHRFPVHFIRRLNQARDVLHEKGIEMNGGNIHGDHGTIYTFINHNFVEPETGNLSESESGNPYYQ